MPNQLPASLSGIINAVADPIFVKDESHRFVLLNEAACRFFGRPQQELLGKSDFDFFPEDEARVFWEKDNEVFQSGKTLENEERLTGADGTTYIISTKKSVFTDDEGRRLLVGVIRDLTPLKQTERELREARDLAQRALQAKKQFVANASHELRTPLNGIVGIVDLLLDRSWEEEIAELLTVLRDSAGNLLNLVNDVLDFASVGTGRLELKPRTFNPRDLLRSVATLFEPQRARKGLTLNTVFPDSLPEQMFGDPNRIRQVLVNLLSNSLKFTPEGGRIEVKAEFRETSPGQGVLTLVVADSGIGIPKEQLDSVRLPFSKARDCDEGTGLGLAISEQLAVLLGGRLTIESAEGEGCEVSCSIPLSLFEGPSVPTPTGRQTELIFPNRRILIVEDDPVSQKVARLTLSRLQCRSDTARDGLEALEMLEKGCYDLVLMDCRMPNMDGYETCREIRKRGFTVPIVALTAHAFEEDREKCLEAGMDDWLTKPLLRKPLIEVLSRQFERPS